MAQTGKLGIADSLLANVQLAFAAADPTPPSITAQSGRLGGQLGDTILALTGVDGPLTFNLSAESVLALAQTADPAPMFAAPSSPDWALGGHDSQLGGLVPAFDGESAALADAYDANRSAGHGPGQTWSSAWTALPARWSSILRPRARWRSRRRLIPAPTFVAHEAPHWVLGGQDSYLGGMELAFAGAADPQPSTGNLTGKLGTANTLLGGVRLALGLQEGVSSGEIINVGCRERIVIVGRGHRGGRATGDG